VPTVTIKVDREPTRTEAYSRESLSDLQQSVQLSQARIWRVLLASVTANFLGNLRRHFVQSMSFATFEHGINSQGVERLMSSASLWETG
jgi:hypothetical protein